MAKKTAVTEPAIHESANDYAEHEKSYRLFLAVLKWSVISTVVLMVFLYFIIAP
jgi:hypothetical protein